MSVISFSEDPTNEAILRASSVRNSRARFDGGEAYLLGFFTEWLPLFLAYDSRSAPGYTNDFSHNERNRQ